MLHFSCHIISPILCIFDSSIMHFFGASSYFLKDNSFLDLVYFLALQQEKCYLWYNLFFSTFIYLPNCFSHPLDNQGLFFLKMVFLGTHFMTFLRISGQHTHSLFHKKFRVRIMGKRKIMPKSGYIRKNCIFWLD